MSSHYASRKLSIIVRQLHAELSHIICQNDTCSTLTFIYLIVFLINFAKSIGIPYETPTRLVPQFNVGGRGQFGGKQTNGVVPLEGVTFSQLS